MLSAGFAEGDLVRLGGWSDATMIQQVYGRRSASSARSRPTGERQHPGTASEPAAETVTQGNVSGSLVWVGELFRDAVRLDASGVILVHNHPSGDPTPSPGDLHLTAEALAAGCLLDVDVLDHLVVGHDAFVSLRDRGVGFDRSTPRATPSPVA